MRKRLLDSQLKLKFDVLSWAVRDLKISADRFAF
jgi:hypothetical protein